MDTRHNRLTRLFVLALLGSAFLMYGSLAFADQPAAPQDVPEKDAPESPTPAKEKVKPAAMELSGHLVDVTPMEITVQTRGKRPETLRFPLAENVQVTIDGKPSNIGQLPQGALVHLRQEEGSSTVVAIRAEGRDVSGTIDSVSMSGRRITLRDDDKRSPMPAEAFPVAADAKIQVGGKPARLTDLKNGMQVRLTLAVNQKIVVAVTELHAKPVATTARTEAAEPEPLPAITHTALPLIRPADSRDLLP